MSDAMIPKEKQSAYQRWEMNSFDDARVTAAPSAAPASARLTIEEQATLRAAAYDKGYAIGLAEGRAAGLQLGRADATSEIDHLRTIAVALGTEAAEADILIAGDVLTLALDLAKAMLKTALQVRPQLLLPIVCEAIRYLPTLHQPAVLYLHPADAILVKEHMYEELNKAGWRVAEDAHMLRGGCRVETASNQIDATIDTRWQRLSVALGQNSEWIEE